MEQYDFNRTGEPVAKNNIPAKNIENHALSEDPIDIDDSATAQSEEENNKNKKLIYLKILAIFIFVVLCLAGFMYYKISKLDINKVFDEQFHSSNYVTHINGKTNYSVFPSITIGINQININNAKTHESLLDMDKLTLKIKLLPLLFNNIYVTKVDVSGVNINVDELAKVNGRKFFKQDNAKLFKQIEIIQLHNIVVRSSESVALLESGNLLIDFNKNNGNINADFMVTGQDARVNLKANITSNQNNLISLDDIVTKIKSPSINVELHSSGFVDLNAVAINLDRNSGEIKYKDQYGTIELSNIIFNGHEISLDSLDANLGSDTQKTSFSMSNVMIKDLSVFNINDMVLVYHFATESNSVVTLKISNINNRKNIDKFEATCELDVTNRDTANKILRDDALVGDCFVDIKQKNLGMSINGTVGASRGYVNFDYNYLSKSAQSKIFLDSLALPESINEITNSIDTLPLLFYTSIIDMDVKIGRLLVGKQDFTDLRFSITKNESTINIKNLQANVFGGVFDGQMELNYESDDFYNLGLSGHLNLINIKEVFPDKDVSGKLSADFNFNLKNISSLSDIKNKLNGNIDFISRNGKFLMYNIAAFDGERAKMDDYDIFTGKFVFNNGRSEFNSVLLKSNNVSISGNGLIDLAQNTIDYDLVLLEKIKLNQSSMVKNIVAPIKITGLWSSPKVLINRLKVESGALALPTSKVTAPTKIAKSKNTAKIKTLVDSKRIESKKAKKGKKYEKQNT